VKKWKPIKSAPKDGAVIRVKNPCMDHPVLARWGQYRSSWGSISDAFVLVEDEGEKFMPMRRGSLIIPSQWQER